MRKLRKEEKDYFELLLETAPASWALIRANEIKAMKGVDFAKPVLDIGCGDGLVAKVLLATRSGKFAWGIDISEKEVHKAKKSGAYKQVRVASVYSLPFANNSFQTVFSNSTIEHLKNLDLALSEIKRVLKPSGELVMTVPSPYLSKYLLGKRFFSYFRLNFLGDLYAWLFHFLVRHYSIYNHKDWRKILSKHKIVLTDYLYYHSPAVIQAHEVFSYLAIPQHIVRLFTGYWPVFPILRKIILVTWSKKIFFKLYNDKVSKREGGSLLLIAKCLKK